MIGQWQLATVLRRTGPRYRIYREGSTIESPSPVSVRQHPTSDSLIFLARRFEAAVPILLLAMQEDPLLPQSYRVLAACYAHMGKLDEGREIIEKLRKITPLVIPDMSHLRKPEHRELIVSGLRLATGEAS